MKTPTRIAACIGMCLATGAHADTTRYEAVLLPQGEGTTAHGLVTAVYDSVENELSFDWVIHDLVGSPSSPGAHFHRGAPGVDGPIRFAISLGDWPLAGSGVWRNMRQDDIDFLNDGLLYVNFHTDFITSGEVRGQVYKVPAPSGVALLGLGALGMGLRRRTMHA